MTDLSRRQALVGAGAVVAAAALPVLPEVASVVEPFWETAIDGGLDRVAAIWGVSRVGVHLSGVPLQWVQIESDDHLRQRLLDVVKESWRD